MNGRYIVDILSYGGELLEVLLLGYLFLRGHWKRLWQVVLYLATLLGVGAARSYTLDRYGFRSAQYGNCYWTTDLFLVLAAFVMIAVFFRRVCSDNPTMWRHLRLLLGTVFVLIAGVSLFSLSGHGDRIYSFFIVQFSQNLYFACLVLTTLLYLMTLRMEIADERLPLLVCGLGIEFAGPAACLALYYITHADQVSSLIATYLFPMCDVGMILTWFYAVSRVPEKAEKTQRGGVRPSPILAEEGISHS